MSNDAIKNESPRKISCRDWNEDLHDVSVDEMSFRPAVYGVIIKDNKILLSPQRDGYDFPGGGMEIYETIEECLLREVKEETGLNVDAGTLLHVSGDFFYHMDDEAAYNTVLMYYTCTNPRGTISTEGFDEAEKSYARKAEWIDIEQIEELKYINPVDSVAIIQKALSLV